MVVSVVVSTYARPTLIGYPGNMRRKPWPWTMKTVFIVNCVLVGLQLIPALLGIGLYVEDAIDPKNPPTTDSYTGLFLVLGLGLLCLAIVLAGVTALLFTRSPLSRIVYSIFVGIGIVASVTTGWFALIPPAVILTATIVLTWLPVSRPYFSDVPGVTYYKNPASLR